MNLRPILRHLVQDVCVRKLRRSGLGSGCGSGQEPGAPVAGPAAAPAPAAAALAGACACCGVPSRGLSPHVTVPPAARLACLLLGPTPIHAAGAGWPSLGGFGIRGARHCSGCAATCRWPPPAWRGCRRLDQVREQNFQEETRGRGAAKVSDPEFTSSASRVICGPVKHGSLLAEDVGAVGGESTGPDSGRRGRLGGPWSRSRSSKSVTKLAGFDAFFDDVVDDGKERRLVDVREQSRCRRGSDKSVTPKSGSTA